MAVLLGLVLRCFHIESHELQYDEAATGYFSLLPWSDLWGGPAVLEPNPPLFCSLAWLVTHAGGSVEQLRYISVISGVLCIPLAWLITHDLAGEFEAAGAALLVAASPQHIAISQYARAYSFLVLCLMCAFLCLLRVRHSAFTQPLQREHTWNVWWWLGYAVAAVAALYTHHTAIVVLTALNAAALLAFVRADDPGRRFLKPWLVANLFIAGLYAPWLPVLASQMQPSFTASSTATVQIALLQRLWNTVSSPFRFGGLPWIDVRLLPVMLLGAWRFRLSRDTAFLVVFLLGGLALMVLASQFRPLLDGKTLAWAGLFATVAAALGCGAAGRLRLPLLAFVALLELLSGLTVLDRPEGWRDVAEMLRETALPRDVLYVNYAASVLPLRHYGWSDSGVDIKVIAKANEEPWFRGHSWPIVAPQAAGGEAARESRQGKRLWLLSYGNAPPDAITNGIAANAVRALHRRTEKLDLSLFLPSAPAVAR
jgi:hypothetical protein